MKMLLKIVLLCISINICAQEGIKFEVEKLSKPERLLRTTSYDNLYKSLILSDLEMRLFDVDDEKINFPFNILAKSHAPDSLVTFDYHSFFNGMYQAYADHRPFVISPDMIWLLISQGFAQHIHINAEKLRDKFVDFDGKHSLIVTTDKVKLDSPASDWEAIFPQFMTQISTHTNDDLINLLTADFSTTTPVEKVASEVTIMKTVEPYFEFIVIYTVCGIPEITLQGTPEDWQKILDKTEQLGNYNLRWWTNTLRPILKEFVKTSQGRVNKRFWRNMFKYHSQKKYGAPKIIDGWIVRFFPYDKNGKRNNLRRLKERDMLPKEIVKVDLEYIEKSASATKSIPLELWSGFIGLEQNNDDFTLTPKIGWMIRKKDIEKKGLKHKLKSQAEDNFGIAIRVKEIPKEIFEIGDIKNLEIDFIDGIRIPDALSKVKIDNLTLSGNISKNEILRIKHLFPNTHLVINKEEINSKYSADEELQILIDEMTKQIDSSNKKNQH